MQYKQYENMIARIAWKLSGRYEDIEDLISIGKLEFYEILNNNSFNPEKGAFSTFLYIRCRNKMINYLKTNSRHISHAPDIDFLSESICFDTLDELKTLSKESKQIINFIFNYSTDILDTTKYMNPKSLRGALSKLLINAGWNRTYVYNCFKEIRTLFQET